LGKRYEFNGELLNLQDIAVKTGIKWNTLWTRARRGLPFDLITKMGRPLEIKKP
jgi:hypothetical protein